ncbi:ectonucleotide pyrophosphatase phosphodiesterase, partial [Perkinsus olseni]
YGPGTEETLTAVRRVDSAIGVLRNRIGEIQGGVNVILTSDHGMAWATNPGINLADGVDPNMVCDGLSSAKDVLNCHSPLRGGLWKLLVDSAGDWDSDIPDWLSGEGAPIGVLQTLLFCWLNVLAKSLVDLGSSPQVNITTTGPVAHIWPHDARQAESIRASLEEAGAGHMTCYLRQGIPERWHYKANDRIPPVVRVLVLAMCM